MSWKTGFYDAVMQYVNDYLIDEKAEKAVRVTDVWDSTHTFENSLGYSDMDHQVDISYRTADGKSKSITYYGSFNTLIEMLTDA